MGLNFRPTWVMRSVTPPYSIHLGQVVLLKVLVSVFARVHCERDADKKGKNLLSRSEKKATLLFIMQKSTFAVYHLVEYLMSLVALPMA